jgi:hypothetical protein
MPGIRLIHSRWSNAHIFETKVNGGRWFDHVPIMRRYEINTGSRRRFPPCWRDVGLFGSRTFLDKDMQRLRHHRRIVWDMPVVAEKQLQGVLARAQRNFGLSLPSPKVQMIEVARNFLIQGGQRAVYEKVMVAAIGPGIPCGGYFYSAHAKT